MRINGSVYAFAHCAYKNIVLFRQSKIPGKNLRRAAECGKDAAAEDGRQQAYGGLRRCTAENGIRVPAQKERKAATFLSFGEPAGIGIY